MLKHVAMLAAGVMVAGGCSTVQKVENSAPERENQVPVMVDQAMQLRQWERSTARYGNGNVVAGPTGFPYITRWNQPEPYYLAEEVPLFVVQSVVSPLVLIVTPPWTPELYSGVTVQSSYTAMPATPSPSGPYAAPTTQP